MTDVLVEIRDLTKLFPVDEGVFRRAETFVHAVDGLNLDIRVGESGTSVDIAHLRGKELKAYRSRVQMIFQDPMSR